MIQKTINAVILGTSVLIAAFWLLFVLLFFSGSLTFGAEPSLEEQLKQKDVYILRLEKKIAELQNRRTGKALD